MRLITVSDQYAFISVCSYVIKRMYNVNIATGHQRKKAHTVVTPHGNAAVCRSGIILDYVTCHILTLPDKVDVWVVVVLISPRVAPREGAEDGIGEQTCHLLLRHGDGVVHASLEEGDRLEEEQRYTRGRSK